MSGTVGSGFGNLRFRNITPKMPDNPLDKSTIVSIYPRDINVSKPTIFPGNWTIKAPNPQKEDFSILTVGSGSWWKDVDEGQPFLEIVTGSIQMADSIVRDFMNGLFACDMTTRAPGIFYVPGKHDHKTIYAYQHPDTGVTFEQMLESAKVRQKNWFLELVRVSDILWARTNGNPLSISDDARLAAQILGLQKVWIKDYQSVQMTNCKACGAMRNPMYPVCQTCKAVDDPDKAKELGLKFVS